MNLKQLVATTYDEPEREVFDDIPEPFTYPLPDEVLVAREFSRRVEEVIATLKVQERNVIRSRIWDELTLDEAGAVPCVRVCRRNGSMEPPLSRERVRQIEAKAFRKLRSKTRSPWLKPFQTDELTDYPRLPLPEVPPDVVPQSAASRARRAKKAKEAAARAAEARRKWYAELHAARNHITLDSLLKQRFYDVGQRVYDALIQHGERQLAKELDELSDLVFEVDT